MRFVFIKGTGHKVDMERTVKYDMIYVGFNRNMFHDGLQFAKQEPYS